MAVNLLRRATETGYYGGQRIEPGQVFNLLHIAHHKSRWMEEVPADTHIDILVTRLSGMHQPPQ